MHHIVLGFGQGPQQFQLLLHLPEGRRTHEHRVLPSVYRDKDGLTALAAVFGNIAVVVSQIG